MTQKDAKTLDKLDKQAAKIIQLFSGAGCELIAPDILQPADVFLDRSGENIRQRAYVFSDLDGAELCLRPDLTVPAARVYLRNNPQADQPARYCYRGPAFRYQSAEKSGVNPREFEQMGVEFFGDSDCQAVEAEVLVLTIEALKTVGLKDFSVHIGDLGLFAAIADKIDMPARWRERMKHHFWRPGAFRDLLSSLSDGTYGDPDSNRMKVLDEISGAGAGDITMAVSKVLDAKDIPLAGLRSLDEIAARLAEQAADRAQAPLDTEVVSAIGDYLLIDGPPRESLEQVEAIAKRLGIDISAAQQAFTRRLDLAQERGVSLDKARFSAEFGRNLEYYTGFVFQLELPDSNASGQIAGGGRYDGLLTDIGAPKPVPAIGCAIHTERLLAAVKAGDL